MNELDQIVASMDFEFFGNSRHGMSVDGMRKALGDERVLFLDVRSGKEVEYVRFPFAMHIPMEELPSRLEELPRDKLIVTFCSTIFRGAVAYAYLSSKGFKQVKGMAATLEDMVATFKPRMLMSM